MGGHRRIKREDLEHFTRFMQQVGQLAVPVIAEVLLLRNAGMARFLNRHFKPGLVLDWVIQKLDKAADKRQASIELFADTVSCECYRCVEACLAGAVHHDMGPTEHRLEVGAVILAPGIAPFDPSVYATYGYGAHPDIVTSLEFERLLSASGPNAGHLVRPSDGRPPTKIAWLQCVGSRDENACDRGYCSSVCCMYANKQAVIAKEHSENPLDAAVFYMDMRTFGKDFDRYHQRAESDYGVRFIRSRIHSVLAAEDGRLRIVYATDAGKRASEDFDMVVLSVGLQPPAAAMDLARRLGVDLTPEGFARTGALAPVRTSRPGVFVCGAFQGPKDIPQSVMEASAAAAHAEIDPALCHGCGTCAAECPGKAIELRHYTDAQLMAKTAALFAEVAA